jgi:hypothetical protein
MDTNRNGLDCGSPTPRHHDHDHDRDRDRDRDLTSLAWGMASRPMTFAPSSPHEGCIDAVRWVLNSRGFRGVGEFILSKSRLQSISRP